MPKRPDLLTREGAKIDKFAFTLVPEAERAPQLGLITLSTDLTIEQEVWQFIGHGTRAGKTPNILHSRIHSDDEVTAENLTAMKDRFGLSLGLMPKAHHFDVIGYGCTSASLLIGENEIINVVKSHTDTAHVTTPLTAARHAMASVGARKIAYLAPYISDISLTMCRYLETKGFEIVSAGTFGEGRDSQVGQIDSVSILTAITSLAKSACQTADAVFVSCTALNCAPIIAPAETALGIPVISSNSALAWHMARLANITVPANANGMLFDQN